MAGEYAFVMKDLRKVVPPKREILRGIWLSFFHGAKIGVVGANGAGKSTLLRIMAGVADDFQGEASPAAGLKIGYLSQEPQLDPAKDVRGNVEDGVASTRALLQRFEEVSTRLGEPLADDEMEKLLEEQGRLQDQIDAVNAWDLDRTVELAMDALRVPPGDMDVAKISGGERRRVALCRLLLARPDMLLLDEPTNHLDAESVAWLEGFLKDYAGTVVAITHDRYFLDNVARWILELDRGHGIPWEGNYSSWLEQKRQRLEQEEKTDLARRLPRGGIVGVIGPNGAGKTTLFRMIAGQDTPDRGTLRVGDSVKLAYVDQSRDALDGKKTVWEEISGGQDVLDVGGRKLQSRAYVASFNFKGSDQQKRVSELSGGERNRLHLAKMLKSGGNVLLLDEPSNDLDVDTLRALEDGLLDFAGCAIVISHDRWFLDRIATHMLAFEDEGRVVRFEGNYQDYEADRRRRLGAEAERPHRLRLKRLPRA